MPSANAVAAARPDFTVDGRDEASLAEGLLSLLIVEDTSGLYRCEATFGNHGPRGQTVDFLYFDRRTLEFGKTFQVKLGQDRIFDGRIMGLEGHFPEGQPPQITVLAEDRFQDLRMTRRTRTFANINDVDLIRQIASDHGLSANIDARGQTHKVLAQVNQSDLAFIRERARAMDAELWMDDRTLNARPYASRGTNALELSYGRDLREFSALADLAHQRTSVTVAGWSALDKTSVSHAAEVAVISSELNGGDSGARILESALGARKESIVHTAPTTVNQAQAEAEALFKLYARRFVTGRGVAATSSQLRAGAYVDLKLLGPLFSGKYYVSEIRHLFDGVDGLRTEFSAERPGLGRQP